MARGTVKKVVADRGFGFITGEDGEDYFFHRDGLAPSLDFGVIHAGERVEFDVEPGQRGPRAVNVLRAGEHPDEGGSVAALESPRWREAGTPAEQGDVERGHRFRNDSSPAERGAIDREGSVGRDSKRPGADAQA